MYRILFLILYLLLYFINPIKKIGIFNDNDYSDNTNRTRLSDFVRLSLRRRSAFKQCRKYLTKGKNFYKLKNDYVTLIYETENKIIKCYDKSIKKRIATIEWFKQDSYELNYLDNTFEETFDSVSALFNEKSMYDGIVSTFKSQFKIEEIDPENEKNIENVNIPKFYSNMFNINQATEKELTDLPGLSIIQAKNIIRYREKHNGFGSLDEFFEEMNINNHLQQQLRNYLYVDSYLPDYGRKIKESTTEEYNITHKDNQNENNERIIDI